MRVIVSMRMRSLLCCGISLVFCLASPWTADADQGQSNVEPLERTKPIGTWYGWEIMLADLGAAGAMAGGGVLTGNSSAFAFIPITGGLAYYTGGPIVHLAHGGGAAGSLVRRLLMPVGGLAVGGGLGALLDSGSRHGDCSEGCALIGLGLLGFGTGMVAAMVTDWVVAREPEKTVPRGAGLSEPSWTPVVVMAPKPSVGLVVRF